MQISQVKVNQSYQAPVDAPRVVVVDDADGERENPIPL
jgi:hypothetical protein